MKTKEGLVLQEIHIKEDWKLPPRFNVEVIQQPLQEEFWKLLFLNVRVEARLERQK